MKRARGPDAWELRYYETVNGRRIRKHMTVGTVAQFPTETKARKAAEGFLLNINSDAPTIKTPTFGAVTTRYLEDEKPDHYSTISSYKSYIKNHIAPRWSNTPLDLIKPMAVEGWLKELSLAPKSKSHIKSLMSAIFAAAQRWELIPLGENPMGHVRVKGGSKRVNKPQSLTVEQFRRVLDLVPEPYKAMVLIAQCTGLRVSEIVGLQWKDFNFNDHTLLVQRGVVHGRVGDAKTEYSKAKIPVDSALASVLLELKDRTSGQNAGDWVFANPSTQRPFHQEQIQKKYLRSAGKAAGLTFSLGWHTFRHTYRSLLEESGASIFMQQELMRHATVQTTATYGQVMAETKRKANTNVVQMVLRSPIGEVAAMA